MFDKFRTTSVFEKNLEAWNAFNYTDKKTKERFRGGMIINQGGSRAGKTVSILQVLFLIAFYSKEPLIISIVSRALPHLKLGAMRDFDNIIQSWGMSINVKNKTDSTYRIGRSTIEFFGADQLDKVHGPARDILFVNEANFVKFDVFDALSVRTSGCIFIDFNPTRKFWAHDFVGKKDVIFIKTTYRDNELIPKKILERIEAKKDNKTWWRVYGEGEIGIAEGAIFTRWGYSDFPIDMPYIFGLDYGFHPDPDALVKVYVDERAKKIYGQECIYETKQGTQDLITNMNLFCKKTDLIIAESASPRTNYDLKKHFPNLEPVSKTKTVTEWLRKMQDYEILITEDSYNLEIELSNYVWEAEKSGVPMQGYDHGIDCLRYSYMRMSRKIRRNF